MSADLFPLIETIRCGAGEHTDLLTQVDGTPCRANSVNWRWSVVPEASLQLLSSTAPPAGGAESGVKEGEGGQKERR